MRVKILLIATDSDVTLFSDVDLAGTSRPARGFFASAEMAGANTLQGELRRIVGSYWAGCGSPQPNLARQISRLRLVWRAFCFVFLKAKRNRPCPRWNCIGRAANPVRRSSPSMPPDLENRYRPAHLPGLAPEQYLAEDIPCLAGPKPRQGPRPLHGVLLRSLVPSGRVRAGGRHRVPGGSENGSSAARWVAAARND